MKSTIILSLSVCILSAYGRADSNGQLRLDKDILAPRETLTLTVPGAGSTCQIVITSPAGHQQTFAATISGTDATASYLPGYLAGNYQVYAVTSDFTTETDSFTVSGGHAADAITITDWRVDNPHYLPGRDLVFTCQLADSQSQPMTGLSPELSDTWVNVDGGGLSILRKILSVAADGTVTARVLLYFDTTGGWSDILTGTRAEVGLFYKDGTALPADFVLSTGTENNGGGHLSNSLVKENGIDRFITTVAANFAGADKTSFVDITIPPGRSVSDVMISVEYFKYFCNTGWGDRITIGEAYVNVPSSGYELKAGDFFATIGRFPIYLPLTPNENGLLVFSSIGANLDAGQINDGAITQSNGIYTDRWTWADYVNTTATFYAYADKWGYASKAYSAGIEISPEETSTTGLAIQNFSVSPAAYMPMEPLNLSFAAADSAGNPVTGLTGKIADAPFDHTGGAMILRRLIEQVNPDGSLRARIQLTFDTTGGWSDIYAGTQIQIRLLEKDGLTPLGSDITPTTGFVNNDDSKLVSTLTDNLWTVSVAQNIAGTDKIAWLDLVIPTGRSASDVVLSVERIDYKRNSGWGDKIVIAEQTVNDADFPKDLNGNIVFQNGDRFAGLGRFPLRVTLNPNPNGFIVYGFVCPDLPELNLNDGTLTEQTGAYSNRYLWNDCIVTTAQVFAYIDTWQHSSAAVSPTISIGFEGADRELGLVDFAIDKRVYSKSDTRKWTAKVLDGQAKSVSGFTLKDSFADSNAGQMSIVAQNVRTDAQGNNIVRLLVNFDTTGSWSDINAGTQAEITILGPDGKSNPPAEIPIVPGSSNAEGFVRSELSPVGAGLKWVITVDQNLAGADRQVFLDFVFDSAHSPSEIVFRVDHILYFCNTGWGNQIQIRNVKVAQNAFPLNVNGQFEFVTGSPFGALGRFPLYLSLNPGNRSMMVKMPSTEAVDYIGTLAEAQGVYTYSHTFNDDRGLNFMTTACISQFGYFNNKARCSESIGLFFSGEPRYLGGLQDEPVMLGTTWQKDLSQVFFIDLNYANVEYLASDPNILIAGNLATFSPADTGDTLRNLVFTARKKNDHGVSIQSPPITLYAADCMNSNDCTSGSGRTSACMQYACQYYDITSPYHRHPQGADLSVFNKDLSISNAFPQPGETVILTARISNTGTVNAFDVLTEFYLDDVGSEAVDANFVEVIPRTYMDLPFRYETAVVHWTIPQEMRGAHRIWIRMEGRFPDGLQEDMLSNNAAAIDVFVADPAGGVDPAMMGPCEPKAPSDPLVQTTDNTASPQENLPPPNGQSCRTVNMLVPISVKVCEDEIECGPVIGYELGYWSTLYWPSWSGYCQEFGVAQEAITDLIRTYERLAGLGGMGAMSDLPSLEDWPGLLEKPEGWSDGWLPCHPEPTMFWYILYEPGVINPGCGGLCPVSAWDCGEGVHFRPRFDSPLYHAYEFKVAGGARKVTRCHTESDWIRVPYTVCEPDGSVPPQDPPNIPFNPFDGGPGDGDGPGGLPGGGYGGGGSGPGPSPNRPSYRWEIGDVTGTDSNPLPFDCYFCSSGTKVSTNPQDKIHCIPGHPGPLSGVAIRRGWNLLTPALTQQPEQSDRIVALKAGWNLFGNSSSRAFVWSGTRFSNGSTTQTLDQAIGAGWIRSTLYYFDVHAQNYKFVPIDSDLLQPYAGYWIYCEQDNLTMILPQIGGAPQDAEYDWSKTRILGDGQSKTIAEAEAAGWILGTVYDYSVIDKVYVPMSPDAPIITPWRGYWLLAYRDDLRLKTAE